MSEQRDRGRGSGQQTCCAPAPQAWLQNFDPNAKYYRSLPLQALDRLTSKLGFLQPRIALTSDIANFTTFVNFYHRRTKSFQGPALVIGRPSVLEN